MTVSEQDRQQIAAVIEQYRSGWMAMDMDSLRAIWDQDYDNILYIPAETAPVRGWAEVEEYYKKMAGFIERVRTMTVSDLSADVFGDVAYAFCNFWIEADIKWQSLLSPIIDGPDTLCMFIRVSFILRRKSGMWKIIHYHESRSPLSAR